MVYEDRLVQCPYLRFEVASFDMLGKAVFTWRVAKWVM